MYSLYKQTKERLKEYIDVEPKFKYFEFLQVKVVLGGGSRRSNRTSGYGWADKAGDIRNDSTYPEAGTVRGWLKVSVVQRQNHSILSEMVSQMLENSKT